MLNRRQKFLSEKLYANLCAHFDGVEDFWKENAMEADSPEQEASLKARHLQVAVLDKLILTYTAGAPIETLIPMLELLVEKYEIYQEALSHYEQKPTISPLSIDDWLDEYEECVQVISLCILLQRTDLLKRFARLIDNADYSGDDTLYEDLLRKILPNRQDVDLWYHDVYTSLIRAVYVEDKKESSQLLKKYCDEWYPAFEQAPWHDSHLNWGDEGSYVGYWAFEAAAIAFLYNIDDSKVDHMVYPKDLVAYARNSSPAPNATQIGRVEAGQPCPRAGYWFTPAQNNSLRLFKQGELMPAIDASNWGDTLWYWSGADAI